MQPQIQYISLINDMDKFTDLVFSTEHFLELARKSTLSTFRGQIMREK